MPFHPGIGSERIPLIGTNKSAKPVCLKAVAAALPPMSKAVVPVQKVEQKSGWGLLRSSDAYHKNGWSMGCTLVFEPRSPIA